MKTTVQELRESAHEMIDSFFDGVVAKADGTPDDNVSMVDETLYEPMARDPNAPPPRRTGHTLTLDVQYKSPR